MVNLITTDSYFNMFELLLQSLEKNTKSIEQKNIIFCEEKVSLMIERLICYKFGGTFSTQVFSFGNFLRAQKPMDNLLTIEGSSMAVKKILSSVKLNCFKASKTTIAPTLYNLIIQLKSAKVTPNDIKVAIENTDGILKNKLIDIYEVYSAYEDFVQKNGFLDQSSYLSHLDEVIKTAEILSGANIYLVGFNGFTAQMRQAVDSLIKRTNNLTAFLCEGDNPLVFVNESAYFIKQLCQEQNYPLLYKTEKSKYSKNARIIIDSIYNPFALNKDSYKGQEFESEGDVFCYFAPNPIKEVERVAQIIKQKVLNGECRYKDMTIALPTNEYVPIIQKVFDNLQVPYFIDERKKAEHHPLIKLIISYIDVIRKNFNTKSLIAFAKNPYFCTEQSLAENFENYLIKYNVTGYKVRQPFTLKSNGEDLDSLNAFRESLISHFEKFDVLGLLERLDVKNKNQEYADKLIALGEIEEGAICAQMYDSAINLLSQMQLLLGDLKLSLKEYRSIFVSGISALEMSIIPQYNDAVFIGSYKQTALGKAKHLFAIGLTNAVPNVQTDMSLLSDDDITMLEEIKVLVEPKINIVNHRNRENFALGLTAFKDSLYLSYPVCAIDGSKMFKSEVLEEIFNLVEYKPFENENGYLTAKQGLKTFAKECGEFSDGKIIDITKASSFYKTGISPIAKRIIEKANTSLQEKLESSKEILISNEISPTTIEDYYKCPYKSFLSHALRVTKREQGDVDSLSVGNLMHQIFDRFIREMDEVADEESSNALFDKISKSVLEREEYKKFLSESRSSMTIKRVLNESKNYCYKTYMSFKNSSFKVAKSEARFGENGDYPPINLLNGQVKMKGKIDRVDQTDDYVRVIDYKTGSTDSTKKSLFAGVKLQLFLYGYAVSQKDKGEKQVAGLYYLPISDKYVDEKETKSVMSDGHTLNESEAIVAQDQTFYQNGKSEFMPITLSDKGELKSAMARDEINRFMDYAVNISELATSQLKEGVIVPSPYEKVCEYCEFKGICKQEKQLERKVKSVSAQTIVEAQKE
ncbi:MAG: hypothetical protein E7372_05105 [Clostridiales bacterium]|nr:hypothetical protein [Clostridiales bacterium]